MPPQNSPENIDVNLSLADSSAINDFTNAVSSLTQQIQGMAQQINQSMGAGTSQGQGGASRPQKKGGFGFTSMPGQEGMSMVPTSGGRSHSAETPPIEAATQGEGASHPNAPGQSVRPAAESSLPWVRKASDSNRPEELGAQSNWGALSRGVLTVPGIRGIGGEQFYREYLSPNNPYGMFETMGAAYGLYRGGLAAAQGVSPILPTTANQVGQGYGLPGGDMLTIPGTNIGFQNPLPFGPGSSPASSEYYGNLIQSVTGGLAPGVSMSALQQWQGIVEGAGWHGDIQNQMTDVWERAAQGVEGEERLPSFETTYAIMDQMIRQGTSSLAEFEAVLTAIPGAANGANQSVDEFAQQLDEAGNTLQQAGLTYGQGIQAALQFSGVTNMSPLVGTQMLENQYVQANIMGRTGLLPQQQGLLFQNTGAFADVTMDTIEQMRDIYSGQFQAKSTRITGPGGELLGRERIGARQQETAMVAPMLGMTPEQLQRFEANEGRMRAQGMLDTAARQYGRDVRGIMEGPQAKQAQQLENLFYGKGRFKGSRAISMEDLMGIMGQRHSGFGPNDIEEIREANPADRAKMILREIRQQGEKKPDDANTRVSIDLTPAAKRLIQVKSVTGQRALDQNAARAGQGRSSEPFANSTTIRPDPTDIPLSSGMGRSFATPSVGE